MAKNIEEKLAVQQVNGRYAIAPHISGGLVTPELLRRFADVAEKYECDAIKLTSAARIALIGIDEAKIDDAWNDIGLDKGYAIGLCVRSVKYCPGERFCPYGQGDTIALGQRLDKRYYGRELPSKLKIGVSGCSFQCAENAIKDIGFIAFRNGWKVSVGGSGGPAPRLADQIAEKLSEEEALALSDKIIDLYEREAPKKMRISKWINKIGLDAFREKLGLESSDA